MSAANLSLQPDKYEFLKREMIYLSHIITKNGVKPDPKKLTTKKIFHFQKLARTLNNS